MDRHVYKSALKVPRDFRSDLVVIPTIYSVSLEPPSQAILGNPKTFQKAPLSAALPSRLYHRLCLERQALPYLKQS
jgi:hypothetical protein